MKSPGTIYRRYRQLKRKFLYEKVLEAKIRNHDNCFYGKKVNYTDDDGYLKKIKLCLLEPHRGNYENVALCTCPRECNAFLNKMTKDSAVAEFEKILSNDSQKSNLYPELEIFEWVLDKDLTEATKSPNLIGKIVLKIIDILEYLLKTFGRGTKNSTESVSLNN